ncbi:hypothetical protein NC652_004995 [Populus alba x Populus x berolinensis]|nr:hypothetical protein NC652_004995 [Populus alba x Populus x berolinensis]
MTVLKNGNDVRASDGDRIIARSVWGIEPRMMFVHFLGGVLMKGETNQKPCRRSREREEKNRKRGGGGKNEAVVREGVSLFLRKQGQEYAQVLRMLGNGRCDAMCIEWDRSVLCHISREDAQEGIGWEVLDEEDDGDAAAAGDE